MNNQENLNEFEWLPCTYNVQRIQNPYNVKIANLNIFKDNYSNNHTIKPESSISVLSTSTPPLKIDIRIEKPLIYTNQLGWNWHKSWNLPTIFVKLEDECRESILSQSKNLYAELFAVKLNMDNPENFHLIEVGLNGISKIHMDDGKACFNSLKFGSTSYKHDNAKFHLMIWIYNANSKENSINLLKSLISPPIFVDSRHSQQNHEKFQSKLITACSDPFSPDHFDKIFVKKENKRCASKQIEIQNDFDGLNNYFTAANIRHKVKHPLFIAIKFSNCMSLYYNKNIFSNYTKNNFVESLQSILYKSQIKSKDSSNLSIEKKPIILCLKNSCELDSYQYKRLVQSLQSIENSVVHVLHDSKEIPKSFVEVLDIEGMKAQYKMNYPMISSSKFKFSQIGKIDDANSENSYDQQAKNVESGSESYECQSEKEIQKEPEKEKEKEPEKEKEKEKQMLIEQENEKEKKSFRLVDKKFERLNTGFSSKTDDSLNIQEKSIRSTGYEPLYEIKGKFQSKSANVSPVKPDISPYESMIQKKIHRFSDINQQIRAITNDPEENVSTSWESRQIYPLKFDNEQVKGLQITFENGKIFKSKPQSFSEANSPIDCEKTTKIPSNNKRKELLETLNVTLQSEIKRLNKILFMHVAEELLMNVVKQNKIY